VLSYNKYDVKAEYMIDVIIIHKLNIFKETERGRKREKEREREREGVGLI